MLVLGCFLQGNGFLITKDEIVKEIQLQRGRAIDSQRDYFGRRARAKDEIGASQAAAQSLRGADGQVSSRQCPGCWN